METRRRGEATTTPQTLGTWHLALAVFFYFLFCLEGTEVAPPPPTSSLSICAPSHLLFCTVKK